jgi:hypothetical protein
MVLNTKPKGKYHRKNKIKLQPEVRQCHVEGRKNMGKTEKG